MSTQAGNVSLTPNLMPEDISLTVRLTEEGIPVGWVATVAITRASAVQQPKAKKKGALRQKKLEDKRRDEGLKKEWVPKELIELGQLIGWPEVLRRAKTKRFVWKFWKAVA